MPSVTDGVAPFAGVPVAVKDNIAVAKMPLTCGSRILHGFVSPYNATAVDRLRAAGAWVVGKTNLDEFGMGSSTDNSALLRTNNPWDPARVAGGSSGGSAAAVAAGLVPVALGSDTGGSIRQPAAFCGVYGLKPTYGAVSRFGLVAYASSLETVGVLASSVAWTRAAFDVIRGHDPLDQTSAEAGDARGLHGARGPNAADGSAGVDEAGTRHVDIPSGAARTIAVLSGDLGLSPAVRAGYEATIERLRAHGYEIRPVELKTLEYGVAAYYTIAAAEASANLARFDGVRYGPRVSGETMWDVFTKTRGEKFGDEVTRRIMLGTYALSAGYYDAFYGQAQKARTLIKRDFEQVFHAVDAVACPVAPTTAFKIGAHGDDPLAMYLEDVFTLPANLAGVPGLAFPVGFDAAGLPVGMQLMGKHFNEATLFRLAHAYQQATDWHVRRPTMDGRRW